VSSYVLLLMNVTALCIAVQQATNAGVRRSGCEALGGSSVMYDSSGHLAKKKLLSTCVKLEVMSGQSGHPWTHSILGYRNLAKL